MIAQAQNSTMRIHITMHMVNQQLPNFNDKFCKHITISFISSSASLAFISPACRAKIFGIGIDLAVEASQTWTKGMQSEKIMARITQQVNLAQTLGDLLKYSLACGAETHSSLMLRNPHPPAATKADFAEFALMMRLPDQMTLCRRSALEPFCRSSWQRKNARCSLRTASTGTLLMESFGALWNSLRQENQVWGHVRHIICPGGISSCCNALYQVFPQIKQLLCSSALLNVTNITVSLNSWNHGWDSSNKFRWGDNNYNCGATALSAQIMRSLPLQEVLMTGLIPVEH